MAQHRRAKPSGQDSAVYLHLKEKGHSFEDSQVHILDRTPLGNRKNVNTVFKSPVQQPNSQSTAGDEDTLEKANSELKDKEASLDKEIAELEAQGYSLEELDKHISLLHEYNELKDTGQILLGRLAVFRGVTTKELYSEFGMDLED